MFKALESGSKIPAHYGRLIGLSRSSNHQLLALGLGRRRETHASVLGLKALHGETYRIYVYLGAVEPHPEGQALGLLFRSDPSDIVEMARYRELYRAALAMVEQQGFAMAEVDLSAQSPAERAALTDLLPFAEATTATTELTAAQEELTATKSMTAPVFTPQATSALDSRRSPAHGLPNAPSDTSNPESRAIQTLGRLLTLF